MFFCQLDPSAISIDTETTGAIQARIRGHLILETGLLERITTDIVERGKQLLPSFLNKVADFAVEPCRTHLWLDVGDYQISGLPDWIDTREVTVRSGSGGEVAGWVTISELGSTSTGGVT